jgi:nucleotide-binding universal stress UspA family protein
MYRRILAAINEHSNSEAAARYALAVAQACDASLTLAFVAPPGLDLTVVREAEAALERLFLEASAKGLEVETTLRAGDPLRHLQALVRERHVDLTFAATRRGDLQRRYFAQTLARRLMLSLPCSVALVRVVHPGRLFPGNILVPIRGAMTHVEERAFLVGKLAEACDARITLFHAPKSITGFFRGQRQVAAGEREAGVLDKMEEFLRHLSRYRVEALKRFRGGRPAAAITAEAAFSRHDLIVMGASARGLLESMLSGNPVEEVLRETPCNLIIHLPRPKKP